MNPPRLNANGSTLKKCKKCKVKYRTLADSQYCYRCKTKNLHMMPIIYTVEEALAKTYRVSSCITAKGNQRNSISLPSCMAGKTVKLIIWEENLKNKGRKEHLNIRK